ncbi:SAM-dependent methyltransferase [Nocardia sp. CDC153]|uniref:SAM-dependent methyltransferase n=1 Tax=Nocardia sp. CDC153 TaxID=3112167 RepID=UPI002DB6335F|nr:SAM-dependent methyltransferase [Nocardia sp. CDC153]MEC3952654.1 SAM-dependent methyltransferase [Nocardia sp. CDC153]
MSEGNRAPVGVDPFRPNPARVYNYMLGGKDNYDADRLVGDRMLQVAPDTKDTAWHSRRFLMEAVRIAAESGIRQFVDIGAGIPFTPNVHEVAQEIEPSAIVASIDFDPVVFAHSNALLSSAPGVTPILADIREPDKLLELAQNEAGIDFSQPVIFLIVGVLHFVMDDEQPFEAVARLRDAMVPGSLLAIQHASTNTHPFFKNTSSNDTVGSPSQVDFRPPEVVERFFEGLEMLPPGLAPANEWLEGDLRATKLVVLCGIGRKN